MNPKRTKEVNFKVMCLSEAENGWYYSVDRELKTGKTYTVIRVRGEGNFGSNNPEEWFLLEVRRWVYPDNFIPLAEWREKQINEILE